MNYLDFIERDSFYDDPLHWSYKTDSSSAERTEDSNDENHWKNDYPDEDENIFADCVDGDDDTRPGVEQLDMDQEWEVSFGSEFGNPLYECPSDDLADNDEFRDVDDEYNVDRMPFRYTSNQTRIMKHLEKLRHESENEHTDSSDSSRSSVSSRGSSGGEEDHN
ncbi:hypothetical protein RP20_CCG000797 [Aedes albopictus]|nr:hypothetical protein RP20_CCG000797 [Aedes albopictus]